MPGTYHPYWGSSDGAPGIHYYHRRSILHPWPNPETSHQMKQISLEVLAGEHGVLHSEVTPWEDHEKNMVITLGAENIPSDNSLCLLITKKQAMAFFDLVPRKQYENSRKKSYPGL